MLRYIRSAAADCNERIDTAMAEIAAPTIERARVQPAKSCWSGEGDEGPSSPGHGAIVVEEAAAGSVMCDCREINHDPCALFHAARTSMAVQIGGNITGRHRIDLTWA
jgi:hypothetical protein